MPLSTSSHPSSNTLFSTPSQTGAAAARDAVRADVRPLAGAEREATVGGSRAFGQLFDRVFAVNQGQRLAAHDERDAPVPRASGSRANPLPERRRDWRDAASASTTPPRSTALAVRDDAAETRPPPPPPPPPSTHARHSQTSEPPPPTESNGAKDNAPTAKAPTQKDPMEASPTEDQAGAGEAIEDTENIAATAVEVLGATWLMGAATARTAGDLQAVPLAGGMQVIAPTQGPDAASLMAFATAQGMSPEAVKLLMGQQTAPKPGFATGASDPSGLTGGGVATHAGPQSSAQLLANILDARALSGAGPGSPPTDTPNTTPTLLGVAAPPTQAMPTATAMPMPMLTELAMTGSLAQAHTLALSGVTDDDIDTLLTSNKLGGFEGLGAERTGLAVPRASLPNGVALPGDTLSATITQRNALYESIAQRLGEALGARIQGQIAKGQWTMQLTLKPASLGTIDVDLQMRNGELEARFVSANPLTRDLLQDSMQRLKDQMAQAGTDVAKVVVDSGSGQPNHGKPTPHAPDAGRAAMSPGTTEAGDLSIPDRVGENSGEDGSLNILV